jgi:hypothetical protein
MDDGTSKGFFLIRATRHAAELLKRVADRRFTTVICLALFPLACGIAAIVIGQDASWNLFNYHIYNAYAFLNDRLATDISPAQTETTLNPLLDLPYYEMMRYLPPVAGGAIYGAIQGLNPVIVYFIGREVSSDKRVAFACALTATVAGGFAFELGSDWEDNLISIPMLLGALVALKAIRRPEGSPHAAREGGFIRAHRMWFLSGLLCGIGAGLKFAELPFAVGACAGAAASINGLRLRLYRATVAFVGLAVGIGVTYGYWAIYLWKTYGDPLLADPVSVVIFHSRYIVRADLPDFLQQSARYLPHSFLTYLIYPFYCLVYPYADDDNPIRELSIPIAYMLVLVLVAALIIRFISRARAGRRERVDSVDSEHHLDWYAIWVLIITLALWAKLFGIYRYLIVLELMAPVVIYCAGRRIVRLIEDSKGRLRGRNARIPIWVFAALMIACMISATAYSAGFGSRVGYAQKFVTLPTPRALRQDRPDVLLQVGYAPMSIFDPELPSWITAVGYLGGLNTPSTIARVKAAVSRARLAGAAVVIDYPGPPSQVLGTAVATDGYLQSVGVTGYEVQGASCQVDISHVGTDPDPLTFCSLRREGT